MASAVIHLCVAKRVGDILNQKSKEYYIGSIAPDISKIIGESKDKTHFITNEESIPNIDLFLNKYKRHLNNPFELGYFVHLYTDKLWYENFSNNIYYNTSIKMKDGTVLNVEPSFISKIIYEDYTNLNIDLIDRYKLDLSIFYEENNINNTFIKEYPIDKVQLLIDKMGTIIENSTRENTYALDIKNIEEFINESSKEILKELENIKCS